MVGAQIMILSSPNERGNYGDGPWRKQLLTFTSCKYGTRTRYNYLTYLLCNSYYNNYINNIKKHNTLRRPKDISVFHRKKYICMKINYKTMMINSFYGLTYCKISYIYF